VRPTCIFLTASLFCRIADLGANLLLKDTGRPMWAPNTARQEKRVDAGPRTRRQPATLRAPKKARNTTATTTESAQAIAEQLQQTARLFHSSYRYAS
jgi:hypothetical protein